MKADLPAMISKLPEISMPMEEVKGYLIQGQTNQAIFFIVKAGTLLPDHTHAAQWGIIIDGEFEITINGKKTLYRKGDSYFIPENTVHSGYYVTDVISFDVFDDNNKFHIKP
ncbi:cupin domain-containing protein [Desulfolutivibrio sulfoxidireducens]|uniref:cupin domain-containing protein n=1 Tax=Desulfolutivibrio sulfoxidireducens TaxID=2773299 RepID=UPI00159D62A6|nr:cupin domain-containing protein [Desulfolutivibrio sulfoxidireducens]QLA17509.1 cupin domain-containing protein [Desulfolutivibrio sulfoxidireducens]